jgi:hypothetical protein
MFKTFVSLLSGHAPFIQQMTEGYVSHIYLLLSGDVGEK